MEGWREAKVTFRADGRVVESCSFFWAREFPVFRRALVAGWSLTPLVVTMM